MNRRNLIILALIVVLVALGLAEVLVKNSPSIQDSTPGNNTLGMRLGLDLEGGTRLVYKASLGNETLTADDMQNTIDILTKRVDKYGVSEATIQKMGSDQIVIQLPGVRDVEEAIDLIGSTAQLEFKATYDINGNPVVDDNGNPKWIPATAVDSNGQEVALTGQYLKNNAKVVFTNMNEPQVAFEFNSEGADLFSSITERLIGKPLGIFLDNELISMPTVKSQIGAEGVIENIPLKEAKTLVIQLNAGALPVTLIGPIERTSVDPSLGKDSIDKSLIAGTIGLVLVILFMVLYYRLPGALAGAALIIYGILMLALFKLIPVTLTLPGIAGFILSIGMAVDANVLIFERLKEELRSGRSLGVAVETGFNRAWPAIRDSNITTIIACVILYWVGSVLVEPKMMGFALTLGIGVALSMFSAIIITRTFIRLLSGTNIADNLPLFGVPKPAQTSTPKEQE